MSESTNASREQSCPSNLAAAVLFWSGPAQAAFSRGYPSASSAECTIQAARKDARSPHQGRVVAPEAQEYSGLGPSRGLPVCKWRRRNVVSQQSGMGWDRLPIADVRDLATTPGSARFGSDRQQRSAHRRAAERCQEDTGSSAEQRTIRGKARWRLRSPNPGEHSRISEG